MPQLSPSPAPPHPRRQAKRLACLTAAVVLGHWTLLLAAPLSAGTPSPASTSTAAFVTRTIQPEIPAEVMPPAHTNAAPVATKKVAPPPPPPTQLAAANTPPLPSTPAAPATPAATAGPTAPKASGAGLAASAPKFSIPGAARIVYDVQGIVGGTAYTGTGELSWLHDGSSYNARLAISKFFIPLRVQTSKGQITPQGLEPTRFGDKKGSEVAAHFERSAGKIIFSANTPDAPLQAGAQDHLSIFMQLGAMLAAEPARYPAGSTLTFQAVGSHYAEQWTFVLGSLEKQTLPGGELTAIKLTRDALNERDSKVETWLAPDAGYLPVHIRLSQPNGDFVDMLWNSTQKP